MSLPVVNINISYEDEKGAFFSYLFIAWGLIFFIPEKIRDFLSKFKSQEKDLVNDFANIDIDGRDDSTTSETRIKYMTQLVRVNATFSLYFSVDFDQFSQQRIANREQQMLVIDLEDIYTVRVLLRVICVILTRM